MTFQFFDSIIVGGGAAGFFAAIHRARTAPGKVLILEKSRQVLSKVKISGGGRCNVTHHCFDPRQLCTHYPRGAKALLGPFHRFGPAETLAFFEDRGVTLKTEADGRIFPTTDDSQTIINALRSAADEAGVQLRTAAAVKSIRPLSPAERPPEHPTGFELFIDSGPPLRCRNVLLATGGARLGASARLPSSLGHELIEDVPSLFAFDINDPRLQSLQGLTITPASVSTDAIPNTYSGPLLITHRGVSGPAILKLSAWGAREFHRRDYRFRLFVNWIPDLDVDTELSALRKTQGPRQISSRSPFENIPKRLWQRLVEAAHISRDLRWAELSAAHQQSLSNQLTRASFRVHGKSTNKDEFVTAGGISTDDVDMRTMESRIRPGLYFAGEILNIDGITGGFNFQNAWTTGYHAGLAMAVSPQ